MIAVEIKLTVTMTCLQLEIIIMHYRNLLKLIFWHDNRQRETVTVIQHLLSGLRHPILHSNILFCVKLFARIILSWSLLKCVLWYLFKFYLLIWSIFKKWKFGFAYFNREKLWTKNLLLSLKKAFFFFKEGKSSFFDETLIEIAEITFSTSFRKFKIVPFQGIRRPKAYYNAADFPILLKLQSEQKKIHSTKSFSVYTNTTIYHCSTFFAVCTVVY